MREAMRRIIQEILDERVVQDDKWGGPEHDDQMTPAQWVKVIRSYASWAETMSDMGSGDKYRRRMLQIAAMALAAVESYDRAGEKDIIAHLREGKDL